MLLIVVFIATTSFYINKPFWLAEVTVVKGDLILVDTEIIEADTYVKARMIMDKHLKEEDMNPEPEHYHITKITNEIILK